MTKKKLLILGLIIILVGGAVFLVMMKQQDIATLSKPKARVMAIGAAEVVDGQLEVTTHFMGTLEPYIRSDLSARISGNILSILKREGDNVRQEIFWPRSTAGRARTGLVRLRPKSWRPSRGLPEQRAPMRRRKPFTGAMSFSTRRGRFPRKRWSAPSPSTKVQSPS